MRLKNILLIALAMFSLTTFTGCIDIVEEMFLNKDGSGKYTMRMDMSGMMSMIKMMSEMDDIMPEDEEDAEEGEEDMEEEDSFDAMLEQGVDSIMYLKNASPEILEKFEDNPEFVDKVNMRLNVNPDENAFFMDFNLDFDNMDDIDYFFKNFDNIMAMMDEMSGEEDEEEGGELDSMLGMGGMGADSPFGNIMGGDGLTRYFDLTKRTLVRREASEVEPDLDMGEDEIQMMQMMFGEAKYKTIYHMPGKVKKMTNKDATLSADKKTVILEGDLMDYIKGEYKVANIIKFGKK